MTLPPSTDLNSPRQIRNSDGLTLEQILAAFEGTEVEKILYSLSALYDMEDVMMASHDDMQGAMTGLLRVIMGMLGCGKGAILMYSKHKNRHSMQLLTTRGFQLPNAYFRFDTAEEKAWLDIKAPLLQEKMQEVLPSFLEKNHEILQRIKVNVFVPLVTGNAIVGCLLLGSKLDKQPFASGELIFLTMIARQVGVHLHNFALQDDIKQKEMQMRKKNAELIDANLGVQKTYEMIVRFSSILDETKLFQAFLEEVIVTTAATKGLVLKFDALRDGFSVVCLKNVEPFAERALLPYRNQEHLMKVMEQKETQIGILDQGKIWHIEARYVLFVPIKSQDRMENTNGQAEVTHVLAVFDKERRGGGFLTFNELDETILTTMSSQISILTDNVKYYELATKDSMTKLYVRRYFEQRLNEQVGKAEQADKPFSVMIMDIDHFKQVNDNFGHHVGDQVIRLVAETIQRNIRTEIDIPARYGGEEFTVIMPEADSQTALKVAERIRQAVELQNVSHLLTGRNITISIGIATYPLHANSNINLLSIPRALLEASDIALYKSKSGGRNRVTLYDEEE